MGKLIDNRIIIDFASTPGEGDLRGSNNFIRDKARAQRIIGAEESKSKRKRFYLGEWHTHNDKNPSPSGRDKIDWRLTYKSSAFNMDFLICIIVGTNNELMNLHIGIQTHLKYIEIHNS